MKDKESQQETGNYKNKIIGNSKLKSETAKMKNVPYNCKSTFKLV